MYMLFMGIDDTSARGADSCLGVYDKLRLAKDAAEELTETHGFTWWQIAVIDKDDLMILEESHT